MMLPTFRESPADAIAIAVEAESLGLDGVFVYDHLWPMGRPDRPALAPFPMLGAIAASTDRLALGTLVARLGVVPNEALVSEFAALSHLAPGRVIAAIGTGDHLSFNENRAYGITIGSADARREAAGHCASELLRAGLAVWIGGLARATIEVAERAGATPNFWQASADQVAMQARRTAVSWAGMAATNGESEALGVGALTAIAQPIVDAGASWLVFGWPINMGDLAEAAGDLRGS
jgi:Luciferase-like monooxygenase